MTVYQQTKLLGVYSTNVQIWHDILLTYCLLIFQYFIVYSLCWPRQFTCVRNCSWSEALLLLLLVEGRQEESRDQGCPSSISSTTSSNPPTGQHSQKYEKCFDIANEFFSNLSENENKAKQLHSQHDNYALNSSMRHFYVI